MFDCMYTVYEWSEAKQVTTASGKNSILDKSGFHERNSTETALLRVSNDTMQRDKGNCTVLLMLDLSAAFDTSDLT